MEELVRQLRDGDDSAGPSLVSVVAPRLLGYARMIAPDLSEADQELVVEEAVETAIRRIDRFDRSKGTFPGWVRTFVRHGVADWRRAHPAGGFEPLDESIAPVAPLPDHVEDEMVSPESVVMAALVLTAPESDQIVLRLRFVEMLTHAQIASHLGVAETACRKRCERALTRLRTRADSDVAFARFTRSPDSKDRR